MVQSMNCHLWGLSPDELLLHNEDPQECGGYFIVNGRKRLFNTTVQMRCNFPMAIVSKSWTKQELENHQNETIASQVHTKYGITIRCVRQDQTESTMTLHYLKNETCNLVIAWNKMDYFIPALVVLRALMNLSAKEISQTVMEEDEADTARKDFIKAMQNQLANMTSRGLTSQKEALKFIGKEFRSVVMTDELPASTSDENVAGHVLKELVCVHLSKDSEKFHLLVFMIRKLFALQSGKCGPDSADSLKHQEVLLGGHLYLMVIKEKLQGYLKDLRTKLEQEATQHSDRFTGDNAAVVKKAVTSMPPNIGCQMEHFLATGDLRHCATVREEVEKKVSVTQSVDRLDFDRYLGLLYPVHPPDGTPDDLLDHLSSTALYTITTKQPDTSNVTKVLSDHKMEAIGHHSVSILLDGKVVGTISPDKAVVMVAKLRELKTNGLDHQVPPSLEIGYVPSVEGARGQYPGLYLFTTPARMVRPVRNLRAQRTELIGSFEQANLNIAAYSAAIVQEDTTHQELHTYQSRRLSVIDSVAPFFNLGRSARTLYQRECHFCMECTSITPPTMKMPPMNETDLLCQHCKIGTRNLTTIFEVYCYLIAMNRPALSSS